LRPDAADRASRRACNGFQGGQGRGDLTVAQDAGGMRCRGRQFVEQLRGFAARLRSRAAGRGGAGVRAGGVVRAAWRRCVFTLAGGGVAGGASRRVASRIGAAVIAGIRRGRGVAVGRGAAVAFLAGWVRCHGGFRLAV
jgi:hypothetical protein